ncbi:hypothetical protein WJX73_005689 [Symbiochloris irregularis]|uniref:P-type Cu(+) transporter n=1 Tax=Symbiochloris irregularis TaxID=706552 RepID=A0AAW1PEQ3_9CHLO
MTIIRSLHPAWVLPLFCFLHCGLTAAQAVSTSATISGKLLWPEETVQAGDVRLLLTLDGGQQVYAWPQASGRFAFHEVPAGSHLLDILAVGAVYPEVLASPLILKPLSKAEYFEKRQPFSLWSLAKSPYGLMIGFGLFAVFVLPKLKMDPEEEAADAAVLRMARLWSRLTGRSSLGSVSDVEEPVSNASTRVTTAVRVGGMSCSACSSALERTFRERSGVFKAGVSLLTKTAEVEHDTILVTPQQLLDDVHAAGFTAQLLSTNAVPADEATARFQVSGMTCSSCTHAVEEALQELPGVTSAVVSLVQQEARVEYVRHLVTQEAMVEAMVARGFEVHVLGAEGSSILRLHLSGITCSHCCDSIQQALLQHPGISRAEVSALTNRAEIHFDSTRMGARDIMASISDLGFEALLASDDNLEMGMQERQREKRFWAIKFGVACIFSIPVFFLSMVFGNIGYFKSGLDTSVGGFTWGELVKWALTTPVQFIIGWNFHIGAYRALKRGSANMDVLVSLGTNAAYIYSVISVLHHRQEYKQGVWEDPKDFFETSALLITFISCGKLLEVHAKGRTSAAITALLHLAPSTATLVVRDEHGQTVREEEVPSALIQRGDLLKVLPGARVPADGEVAEGRSYIDESMITGESRPISKSPGQPVIGGTVNNSNILIIKALRVGGDATLSQIVRLVERAQMARAPIQAVADRISAKFVPFVLLAATATWLCWFVAGTQHVYPDAWLPQGQTHFLFALLFGISVLVVACPCALGLATPTAVMVGTGVAATNGILIKGADALERAHSLKVIVFDKTGTLTKGTPSVVDLQLFTPGLYPLDETLHLAAAAEAGSEHPLGRAVLGYARSQLCLDADLDMDASATDVSWIRPARDAETVPGKGIKGWVASNSNAPAGPAPGKLASEGQAAGGLQREVRVLVGNKALMAQEGVQVPREVTSWIYERETQGATCVLVAVASSVAAALAITDPLKPEAVGVVAALRGLGLQCYMVTGDNWTTARVIADKLGILNVMAEVQPDGKAEQVKLLQATHRGGGVAMVGDGVNDSPALAQADVGIAIGSGTDIAVEAADYVLMRSDLEDVLTAIDLSKKTFRRIWHSLVNSPDKHLKFKAYLRPWLELARVSLV